MYNDIIIVTSDPSLKPFISNYFERVYSYESVEAIKANKLLNNSILVIDIREENQNKFNTTLNSIGDKYNFTSDKVFVITDDNFNFDNLYFSKFPFIYDIFETKETYDLRIIKRLKAFFSKTNAIRLEKISNQIKYPYDTSKDCNNIIMELLIERDALKEILNKLEFGVIIYSRDNQIYFLNNFAFSILGRKKDTEFVTLNDLFDYDISKIIEDQSLKAKKSPVTGEFLIQKNKDISKKIEFTISPYLINEIKETGFIITLSDMILPNTRENIFRVDKLASLGIMASGIAHEIRNPLAGIRMITETLSQELTNKDLQEYTDRIIRQVNRLSTLLKSFLTFARPSQLEKIPSHLNYIFKEVIPLFVMKLKEKKVTLHENYCENLEKIAVAPSQIQQVLFNVILNAIDAMPEGGDLYIATKSPTKFKSRFEDRFYVEMNIRDTGIGIDDASLRKVYDPFFTSKATGTGLGLSIVHQIISEHRGIIDINSEPNDGTEVRIFLPVETKI